MECVQKPDLMTEKTLLAVRFRRTTSCVVRFLLVLSFAGCLVHVTKSVIGLPQSRTDCLCYDYTANRKIKSLYWHCIAYILLQTSKCSQCVSMSDIRCTLCLLLPRGSHASKHDKDIRHVSAHEASLAFAATYQTSTSHQSKSYLLTVWASLHIWNESPIDNII